MRTVSPRFGSAVVGIPLSLEPEQNKVSLDQFKDMVQHYDGWNHQYDIYYWQNEKFEASVYQQGDKLYGGVASTDHSGLNLLFINRLVGKEKSWAGDKDPQRVGFQFMASPSGSLDEHVAPDQKWVLMTNQKGTQPMMDALLLVQKQLFKLA